MSRSNKLFHATLHRLPWGIGWKAQRISDFIERNVTLTTVPLFE